MNHLENEYDKHHHALISMKKEYREKCDDRYNSDIDGDLGGDIPYYPEEDFRGLFS